MAERESEAAPGNPRRFLRALWAAEDMKDRKRAAEARARLAAIVQSSHDAIISRTVDGVVTDWNPGAEALYGYSSAEMIGGKLDRLILPQSRDDENEILESIIGGERLASRETIRVRKDGTHVTVAQTLSPILDSKRVIVGIASVSRDMSERHRADAMLRGFLEAAPDAMVGVNSSGHIAMLNAHAERLFGYTREELVGESAELLVRKDARAIDVFRRARSFAHPEQLLMGDSMQFAARRRDGSEFPVEISLSSLHTPAGVIVMADIRDITQRLRERAERDQLRTQLHQAQRLESLGQLAGGIAHDFNNLIAVIVNYAAFVHDEATRHLALTDTDSGIWQTVQKDVEQIELAGERASQLMHRLLAFGRRAVVRPEVIDLNRVVRDVEQVLRRTIGEHVELGIDLQDQLHTVLADPGQIEQVVLNLAVNARNAMPTGGTLTIDTEDLVVDDEYIELHPNLTAGPYVCLRVSDTGTGMTPDVINHAFEPFFTTKPQGEGAGLGLATVYGIISQANGDVHMSSEPGLGTTVTVVLPATEEVGPVATAPTAPGASLGETILVVEDEDAIREVARRILSRSGYEVLTAANGDEALTIVTERGAQIDMLLSDVIMPRMLGKEVAEKVHEILPDLPVLFMSGYAQPILTNEGRLDPGVTLLEKPFSELILLTKVRETLDTATWASPPQTTPVP